MIGDPWSYPQPESTETVTETYEYDAEGRVTKKIVTRTTHRPQARVSPWWGLSVSHSSSPKLNGSA